MRRPLKPGPPRDLRLLAFATAANAVGSGMYLPVAALYLTQVVGLSVPEAGIAFLVAGLAAIGTTLASGWAIDRIGAQASYLLFVLGSLAGMLGIIVANSAPVVILSLTVFTMMDRAAAVARSALIGVLFEGAVRMRYRAYLRSIGNGALGIGALLTIPILSQPSSESYVIALTANAASYLVCGLLLLPIRNLVPVREASKRGPITDRRFIVVALLIGIVGLHIEVLGFGLPLWVREQTTAPEAIIAIVIVVNTVGVMLFQVLLSRGTEKISIAARALAGSSLFVGVSLVALGFSGMVVPAAAVALLLFFAVLFTVGEILFTASSLGLTYAYAADNAHGRYQAVLNTSLAISRAVAPSVIGLLCIELGLLGWVCLAVLIGAAGIAAFVVIRRTT